MQFIDLAYTLGIPERTLRYRLTCGVPLYLKFAWAARLNKIEPVPIGQSTRFTPEIMEALEIKGSRAMWLIIAQPLYIRLALAAYLAGLAPVELPETARNKSTLQDRPSRKRRRKLTTRGRVGPDGKIVWRTELK
jgi:hypothetical protein